MQICFLEHNEPVCSTSSNLIQRITSILRLREVKLIAVILTCCFFYILHECEDCALILPIRQIIRNFMKCIWIQSSREQLLQSCYCEVIVITLITRISSLRFKQWKHYVHDYFLCNNFHCWHRELRDYNSAQ